MKYIIIKYIYICNQCYAINDDANTVTKQFIWFFTDSPLDSLSFGHFTTQHPSITLSHTIK